MASFCQKRMQWSHVICIGGTTVRRSLYNVARNTKQPSVNWLGNASRYGNRYGYWRNGFPSVQSESSIVKLQIITLFSWYVLHMFDNKHCLWMHSDVIKWKQFPRYWPFREDLTGKFHSQMPVMGSVDVFLTFAWTNYWANHRDAGHLRRHHAHFNVNLLILSVFVTLWEEYTCRKFCPPRYKMYEQWQSGDVYIYGIVTWNIMYNFLIV